VRIDGNYSKRAMKSNYEIGLRDETPSYVPHFTSNTILLFAAKRTQAEHFKTLFYVISFLSPTTIQ